MKLTKWQAIVFVAGSFVFILCLSSVASISTYSGIPINERPDAWYLENLPSALVAWGTLMLATATFLLIQNSNEREKKRLKESRDQEKRDREERLLNETIRWLKELESSIFPSSGEVIGKEMQEDSFFIKNLGMSLETLQSLRNLDETLVRVRSLENEIKEGEYILKLSSRLNRDLGSLIEVTLSHLKQRKQLVLDSPRYFSAIRDIRDIKIEEHQLALELIRDDTKSLDGLTLSEHWLTSVRLGRNAGVIKKSILNALDKVVEIKLSLL